MTQSVKIRSSALKMEAAGVSWLLVHIYQTTPRHIPEYSYVCCSGRHVVLHHTSIITLAKFHIFGSLFHTKFQHPTLNVSNPQNNTAAMLILLIRGGGTLGVWFLCRKVSQLVKKFPALYGARKLIIMFTRRTTDLHPEPVYASSSHSDSLRSFLILFSLLHQGLPSSLLPTLFSTKI
jgi:hypothetical protein